MKPLTVRAGGANGPESRIHDAIVQYLEARDWFCKSTHGNQFQAGFPDIYATHARWGPRWIEVKRRLGSSFTGAQITDYPKFISNGSPIWVLIAATDEEYQKLFEPPNLLLYLRSMQE